MICKECKRELESGSVFCPYCGNKVLEQHLQKADDIKQPHKKTRKKTRKILKIALIITAAVAIAATAFYFIVFTEGNPPSIDEIIYDLQSRITTVVIDNEEEILTIVNLEIDNNQTNRISKTTTVLVVVDMENTDYSYIVNIRCDYEHIDGVWNLRNYRTDGSPTVRPLSGISSARLSEIENELSREYDTVELVNQESNVDNMTDRITFSVSSVDTYEEQRGSITFFYEFSDHALAWARVNNTPNLETSLVKGLNTNDIENARIYLLQHYGDAELLRQTTDLANFRDKLTFRVSDNYGNFLLSANIILDFEYRGNNYWHQEWFDFPEMDFSLNIEGSWVGTTYIMSGQISLFSTAESTLYTSTININNANNNQLRISIESEPDRLIVDGSGTFPYWESSRSTSYSRVYLAGPLASTGLNDYFLYITSDELSIVTLEKLVGWTPRHFTSLVRN